MPTPRFVVKGDFDGNHEDEVAINFNSDDHFHTRKYNSTSNNWSSLSMLDPIVRGCPSQGLFMWRILTITGYRSLY
ncbi:MAG: hypothetical protein QXT63_02565 [Thermoplasmata archaeon]